MPQPTSKPRVFVSSTISDFRDLRSALKFWLEEMGVEVQMSEFNDFQRRPDQGTFDSCFSAIEDCDYYVLLVGGCRGSWYVQDQVSVTQQEYRVAVSLASKGKLKPVIFIRDKVMTALNESKALREKSADPTAIHGGPSSVLKDPEFVASFIEEIEQTQLDRGGAQGPAGFVWHYRFGDFEDIVRALQVNLNLHRSIHRQALLANLKWEIEANIAILLQKSSGNLPFPHHWWLSRTRRTVRLSGELLQTSVALALEDARHVLSFWLFLPDADRIKVSALQETILSGEFLAYEQESERLTGSVEYVAMQELLTATNLYRNVVNIIRDRVPQRDLLFHGVREGRLSVSVSGHDLALLYRLHDAMDDILRLCVALMRYILDPTTQLEMPTLNPVSPIEEEVPKIHAAQATHEDVEQWARDGYLWGWVTGEQIRTMDDLEDAMNRYPAMKDLLEPIIQSLAEELTRRAQSEGVDAAIKWLASHLAEDSDGPA